MSGAAKQTEVYSFRPGRTALVISMPHVGTKVPEDVRADFSEAGQGLADTDWHLDVLYDFAGALGAGVLASEQSRYLIDLNRDPTGASLYPGRSVTELCPTTTFDEEPIYRPGRTPDEQEVAARVERYWRPYHAKLRAEMDRVRTAHGHAVLFEAHSIRSVVPRFFQGVLPDFNLGTADGATASPRLEDAAWGVLDRAAGYNAVRNGRFKGGYLTRAFGRPEEGWHALQLEMAQACYMREAPPWTYDEDKADRLRPVLRDLIGALTDWRP